MASPKNTFYYHFLKIVLRGPGPQNLTLPQGASYPRYSAVQGD